MGENDHPLVCVDGCSYPVSINALKDAVDPKSVAEAIQYLINNPEEAKEMGVKGRSAIVRKYNGDREE